MRTVKNIATYSIIALLKYLLSRWGLPVRVITKNGKQLVFCEIEKFSSSLGILHLKTALYQLYLNGAILHFNRFLKDQLRLGRVEN